MLSKLVIITVAGTGLLGTGAAISPQSGHVHAGPFVLEAGNGQGLAARISKQAEFGLRFELRNGRTVTIKF